VLGSQRIGDPLQAEWNVLLVPLASRPVESHPTSVHAEVRGLCGRDVKLTFAPYITEVMNVRICTFILQHGFMAWFLKQRDKFSSSFFYTVLELLQNIRELGGNKDIARKREDVTGRWRKLYIEVLHNLFS
jgi:hypothetical protein